MSERLNSNLARKGKKPFLVEIHAQIVDSLSVKQKESKSTNTFVRGLLCHCESLRGKSRTRTTDPFDLFYEFSKTMGIKSTILEY